MTGPILINRELLESLAFRRGPDASLEFTEDRAWLRLDGREFYALLTPRAELHALQGVAS